MDLQDPWHTVRKKRHGCPRRLCQGQTFALKPLPIPPEERARNLESSKRYLFDPCDRPIMDSIVTKSLSFLVPFLGSMLVLYLVYTCVCLSVQPTQRDVLLFEALRAVVALVLFAKSKSRILTKIRIRGLL